LNPVDLKDLTKLFRERDDEEKQGIPNQHYCKRPLKPVAVMAV
jgi:hypothetical protein